MTPYVIHFFGTFLLYPVISTASKVFEHIVLQESLLTHLGISYSRISVTWSILLRTDKRITYFNYFLLAYLVWISPFIRYSVCSAKISLSPAAVVFFACFHSCSPGEVLEGPFVFNACFLKEF